jgi:hypothetical protein
VEQTCAAVDVCCFSFPAGGRCSVVHTSALHLRNGSGTSGGGGGCCVVLVGGSAVLVAVSGGRVEFSGANVKILGTGVEVSGAEGWSVKLCRRCSRSALSDATCRMRSSISSLNEALLGVGEMLATAGWGATSEMQSSQRAAMSKLHSG